MSAIYDNLCYHLSHWWGLYLAIFSILFGLTIIIVAINGEKEALMIECRAEQQYSEFECKRIVRDMTRADY